MVGELHRTITKEQHAAIRVALWYDRRRAGNHGRSLRVGVPSCDLLANDRLEPSDSLPDVSEFDAISAFPARVTFWRGSAETICKHRSPLFSAPFVSPALPMIDLLHTVHVGVMYVVCRHAVWELLVANAWHAVGTEQEALEQSVIRIFGELSAWHKRPNRPDDDVTQIQDLTVPMLGTKDHRDLKLKAMETKGFLPFVVHLLRSRGGVLPAEQRDALLLATKFLSASCIASHKSCPVVSI